MRELDFPADARQRLASQLGSLRSGCSKDLTTPLVPRDGRSGDIRRAEVADSLSAATQLGALSCSELVALESDKRLKHGTFSRRPGYVVPSTKNDSLRDLIRRYFTARDRVILHTDSVRYANESVSRLYPVSRFGRLSPLPLDEAAAMQFPSNTGLGFPFVSSDSSKYLYHVYKISEEIHNSGYDVRWVSELPAILGVRGQPRGPDTLTGTIYAKTRVIYAMPRALMNVEKQVQYPLQGVLGRLEVFSAWVSRAAVAKAVTRLFARKSRDILSVDFKSFDASVPEVVLNYIFEIIAGWMTVESGPIVRFIQEAFMRTGILCPDEYFPGSSRSGGVPSGSVMTNLIDSLVNLWVMHYAASRVGSSVLFSMAQGDDGLYTFQGTPTKHDLSQAVAELGMTISEEKSMMGSEVVHYLQDMHSRAYTVDGVCVGVRPLQHVLNSAMSYERIDGKSWDRDCDTIRWLQQFEEAVHHPSFRLMCDWLYKHDWNCAALIDRLRVDGVTERLDQAVQCVMRKDSNSFKHKGLSGATFAKSPIVQYLLSR